jgi:hypothetical protein
MEKREDETAGVHANGNLRRNFNFLSKSKPVGRMYIVAALHGKPFTLWNVKRLSDVIYQAVPFLKLNFLQKGTSTCLPE